ncbi:MAG: dTDP-4-dehydrorhamnose reductase [Alphaproteobacteria bacterium]
MRILLTGANGQLGTELRRCLEGQGWALTAVSRQELDIADADAVEEFFSGQRFDLVVNAAAYTAVDGAETEQETAFRVNAGAPGRLARLCAAQGASLIHFSTDYIFDGTKPAPYRENDPPCPANAYGRSKEAGERAIREALERHLIIRTAWLFGARGGNFVKTMLRLSEERDELSVVADQHGNPTAACDLANCTAELTRKLFENPPREFAWGTYHCVNRDAASWFEFAEAIFGHAAPVTGRRPVVRPITTSEFPTPAARPANSRLDCTKLERTFGIVMPSWRRTLPHVIDEILSTRATPQEV